MITIKDAIDTFPPAYRDAAYKAFRQSRNMVKKKEGKCCSEEEQLSVLVPRVAEVGAMLFKMSNTPKEAQYWADFGNWMSKHGLT